MYKSLAIEIRPRLQSCNVFIRLADNSFLGTVEIVLTPEAFRLLHDGRTVETITVPDCHILTDSLSSLNVTSSFVSFRFSTRNKNRQTGSYGTELVMLDDDGGKSGRAQNETAQFGKAPSSRCAFFCSNCKQSLSDTLTFKRILPLPSDQVETNEFFCHFHGDPASDLKLEPQETDIFYGGCYVHLNGNVVSNVRKSGTVLVCRRCLQWLGVARKGQTVRLWTNTVCTDDNEQSSSDPLRDVYRTVLEHLNESGPASAAVKVMLECPVSGKETNYLLLWILEKKLNLMLKMRSSGKAASAAGFCNRNVAKVLFKFESGGCSSGNGNAPIVKQWFDDAYVTRITVSKPMIVSCLKKLQEMCSIIPAGLNSSNNFHVTYFMMYDCG